MKLIDAYRIITPTLIKDDVNFSAFGQWVAENHPKILAEFIDPSETDDRKIIAEYNRAAALENGSPKIAAVRLARQIRGEGLKDAKDYVEQLIPECAKGSFLG